MTPTQHVLHLLAFGAAAVASVLLAPWTLLAVCALAIAAFIKLARETSDTLDTMATA